MNEEPLNDSAVPGMLEQLEQRYPDLANLVSMRASQNRSIWSRTKRAEAAPEQIHAAHVDDLSHEEQQVMSKWMQPHYDRLADKLNHINPKFAT